MRALLIALLLVLGCSGGAPEPITPSIGLDENLADRALSAVLLWERASGGLYAPETHIGCDGSETLCIREIPGMIEKCGEVGESNGCYSPSQHEIQLSEGMYFDEQIYTLAHEIGHSLGLEHAPIGLMVARGARHTACIDTDTLDAFASHHGADRATLETVCYDDDIRAETLARLAEIE